MSLKTILLLAVTLLFAALPEASIFGCAFSILTCFWHCHARVIGTSYHGQYRWKAQIQIRIRVVCPYCRARPVAVMLVAFHWFGGLMFSGWKLQVTGSLPRMQLPSPSCQKSGRRERRCLDHFQNQKYKQCAASVAALGPLSSAKSQRLLAQHSKVQSVLLWPLAVHTQRSRP